MQHSYSTRIYHKDTDAQGVVHHANYLVFFEKARTEFLRELNIELPLLLQEYGVQFVVVGIDISYKKPAQLDDLLIIDTKIKEVSRVRVCFEQIAYKPSDKAAVLTQADVHLVSVNKDMRACELPSSIKLEFLK